MDGPREYHTKKIGQTEKDIYYITLLRCRI